MMKTWTVCGVVAAGLLAVLINWSRMSRYATGTFLAGMSTFYSSNEMFIFVAKSAAIVKERRVTTWLRSGTDIPLSPENIKEDLLVFHYKDGQVSRSEIEGTGFG